MPTLDYVQGFEHRIVTEGILITGAPEVWATVSNPTGITSVTGRLSGYGLQVVQDGVTATFVMHKTPTSQTRVFSGYFLVPSAPSVDSVITLLTDTGSTTMCRFDVRTSGDLGVIRAQVGGGSRQTGPAVATNTWHHLTYWMDATCTTGDFATWACHWAVDGATLTTATEGGHVATQTQKMTFGSATAAHTATVTWDDVVCSVGAGDFPISGNRVLSLLPTGDGTHNNGAGDIQDDLNVDIGTTTAWDKIDNWLPTTTPFITQHTANATHYAEVTFDNTAEPVVWGVHATAALWASGSTVNDVTVRIVDAANATLVDVYSGDTSQTTIRWTSAHVPPVSTDWTPTDLNGLKGRFGFSGGSGTDPRLSGLLLEYAVPTTVSVDAVTATATAAALTPALGVLISAVQATATGTAKVPALNVDVNIQAVTATAFAQGLAARLTDVVPTGRLALGTHPSVMANIVLAEPGLAATIEVLGVTATATAAGKVPVITVSISAAAATAIAQGQLPGFFGELAIVPAVATAAGLVPVLTVSITAETATATATANPATVAISGQNNTVAGVTATATADAQVPVLNVRLTATPAAAAAVAYAAGIFSPSTGDLLLIARYNPSLVLDGRWNPDVELEARKS